MIRRLLLIPGAPLLVPELSGADAGAAELRAAVRAAVSRVLGAESGDGAGRSRPVIVRRPDDRFATSHAGSFRAWGAGVEVGGGHHLPELVARWVIGDAGWDPADVDVTAQLPDPFDADATGPIVIVAEGPSALTARAPLTLLPDAEPIDDACAAIAEGRFGGDPGHDPFGEFGPNLCDSVGLHTMGVWQDLASFGSELSLDARTFTARQSFRGAPHGVGYHVAEWEWEA
ncbi:hypothetical protein ACFWGD_00800 [Corynebacterium sp. NPDC060344]|uniref:hypothetical protein n=1 Tax=Corynebacterium sp. NPDC060344 TaxID=3347101 RepID=UPI00364ADE56